MTPDYIAIGRLGKPHGVHGEIFLDVLTDFPERFQPGARFHIGPEAGPEEVPSPPRSARRARSTAEAKPASDDHVSLEAIDSVAQDAAQTTDRDPHRLARPVPHDPPLTATVVGVRPDKHRLLITFDIAGDRDEAAQLTGQYVYIPTQEAHALDPDTYYPHQLIGLRAVTSDDGREIGVVRGLVEVGEVDVLQIRPEQGGPQLMVPMVGEFIADVDIAAGTVVVIPVEGLLE